MQASEVAAAASSSGSQQETFEVDQWILDFAHLFRESLNIEPDRHLDLSNMGWDRLQARPLHQCFSLRFLCSVRPRASSVCWGFMPKVALVP